MPILYRYAPIYLTPYRLLTYLNTLLQTANVPGAVVEVGCAKCGTAIMASRFLKEIGVNKPYIGIDTFAGFVPNHLDSRTRRFARGFTTNSLELAEAIVRLHRAQVKLIQADIVNLPAATLPDPISVALVDVDVAIPTRAALEHIYPRLSRGGMILVDDCDDGSEWTAREGYLAFVSQVGIEPTFIAGMGAVTAERR